MAPARCTDHPGLSRPGTVLAAHAGPCARRTRPRTAPPRALPPSHPQPQHQPQRQRAQKPPQPRHSRMRADDVTRGRPGPARWRHTFFRSGIDKNEAGYDHDDNDSFERGSRQGSHAGARGGGGDSRGDWSRRRARAGAGGRSRISDGGGVAEDGRRYESYEAEDGYFGLVAGGYDGAAGVGGGDAYLGDSFDDGAGGDDDDESGPLQSDLAAELRELERLYGAADRTRSGIRSRQRWLDRRAAERQAVYGARHRDADVRLLALRRHLAAEGRLRRRGRFAPNDALPRPSTWHKLPPATQRLILDERAAALAADLGLSPTSGRRLYLAAPGLLCDISYGVAARLRTLAARLGCSPEIAAAAIAARPLLGEVRLDRLEAVAAELSVWVTGGGGSGGSLPLSLALQRLSEEPSLALDGAAALLARCEALCGALGLSRLGALQYMVRQPRLMTLDPRVIPVRVAAARRLMQLMAAIGRLAAARQRRTVQEQKPGRDVAVEAANSAAADSAAAALGGRTSMPMLPTPRPSPSLLLCTGPQMGACLTLLQQLLALQPPAAAAMLASQPALALQPPPALTAAVNFLCTHLPAAALATAQLSAGSPGHRKWDQQHGRGLRPRRRQPAAAAAPPPLSQPRRRQQQLPPPHVQMLVQRCPDILLLIPDRAATALKVLAGVLAKAAVATAAASAAAGERRGSRGDGSGARGRGGNAGHIAWRVMARQEEDQKEEEVWARGAAAAMAARAPRLLLCKLIPPADSGGGGGHGGGGGLGGAGPLARGQGVTILRMVKAIYEAQRKRQVNAAALALDGPAWPRPLVALPYEYGVGAVAPAAGSSTRCGATSVLDNVVGAAAAVASGAGGGGGRIVASSGESALLAAAAVAGVGPIPLDLGLREAELLHILLPGLWTPEQGGASSPSPPAGGSASYGMQELHITAAGSKRGRAMWGNDKGAGGGEPLTSVADVCAVRSWLWREVLTAEPGLLLVPSAQLVATVAILSAWLAVPAGALSYYLFPYGMAAPRPAARPAVSGSDVSGEAAGTAAGAAGKCLLSTRRRQHHAALLALPSEELQRAGYQLWAWLGGAAVASAADVAAVLRVLPGLLYDSTVGRSCARVLYTLLGDALAAFDSRGSGDVTAAPQTDQEPPAWVHVVPPAGASMNGGGGWVNVAGRAAAQDGGVPAMPAAAAALLLRFPAEVLSNAVLQLLTAAPSSIPAVTGADAGAATTVTSDAEIAAATAPAAMAAVVNGPTHAQSAWEYTHGAASDAHGAANATATPAEEAASASVSSATVVVSSKPSRSRLERAVGLLSELLGLGRVAAAALVLTTHGSAAQLADELSPAARAGVERAMAAVRRGDAWRRELRRYLYGSTSEGGSGIGVSGLGLPLGRGGSEEALDAVNASAWKLVGVLRDWRRVERLEALEAAGLQDAVSFSTVLQLPEDDWRDLATRLQL